MKVCGSLFVFIFLFFVSDSTLAISGPKHNKVVTCYVASWAVYRPTNGLFGIDHIKPELCTHLVYAFAGLSNTSWTIKSLDPGMDIQNDIGNYRKMTQLRRKHPHLKVLLAIGGWNEGSLSYSHLASFSERRSTFVNSVVNFLGVYDFDGFDIDWEYPASRQGAVEDKQNFVLLVKELKEAFKGANYMLTAAISANKGIIDGAYNITELSKYLDYIHVMTYDYHGAWDKKVLPNAPLKGQDHQSVEDTLNYLLSIGAPPSKLVLGLPMYGRTFILANKGNSRDSPINKETVSDGFSGPYTRQNGFMGYNEICELLVTDSGNWATGWDDYSETPYAVNDDRVIVYDNPKSMKAKVEYALAFNLSGVMIWSIDTDDFNGKCASLRDSLDPTASNFPLMRSINAILASSNSETIEEHTDHSGTSIERFSYSCLILIALSMLTYYV